MEYKIIDDLTALRNLAETTKEKEKTDFGRGYWIGYSQALSYVIYAIGGEK